MAGGFTLLELLITLAISGIVAGTIGGAVQATQLGLMQQLDNLQARQNGRIALEVLEYYVRQSGYGALAGTRAVSSVFPIGHCKHADDSVGAACNDQDTGSDRLRVLYAGDAGYTFAGSSFSGGTLTIGASDLAPVPGHPWSPLTAANQALISGTCNTGQPFAQLATVNAVAGAGSWYQRYSVSPDAICTPTGAISMAPMSGGVTVDFLINKASDPPSLRMDRNDGSGPFDVAYYVEDLQVRYGVDVTLPDPDGTVEIWCDNLTDTANCGPGFNTEDRLGRVRAVQLAVVTQTPGRRAADSSPLQAFDHAIAGGDGHRRFMHRTTVALRNR
jgi:prepilin-type N-terminal cleavage/methylation domain-containing protein